MQICCIKCYINPHRCKLGYTVLLHVHVGVPNSQMQVVSHLSLGIPPPTDGITCSLPRPLLGSGSLQSTPRIQPGEGAAGRETFEHTAKPEVGAPRPPARLPQKKSPLVVHVVVENRQSTGSDGGYEQIKDVGCGGVISFCIKLY